MRRGITALLLALAAASSLRAEDRAPAPAAWVARSNAHADVLVKVFARFGPEQASQFGVTGVDEQVVDLGPGVGERLRRALAEARAELERRRAAEADPLVKQDLDILLRATQDSLEESEISEKKLIPLFDVPQTAFLGLRALLDDQVAPERRKAALVRLRKYAGLEPGSTALATQAQDRMRERMAQPGLLFPVRAEVEKQLGNGSFYLDGLAKLLGKYQLQGWEEAHARLAAEVKGWDEFLKGEVLPRAREDFRLPPELYAFSLRQRGVDLPPELLADRARIAFVEIRNEMRALAPLVAREKGFPSGDYRDVIRELKKTQLVGEAILPHYRKTLAALEETVRREKLLTLPAREARIRLASEAESASIPAPNMRPPRLIGNTGEQGEFVLPLNVPTGSGQGAGGAMKRFDDFSFEAAAWTLTVHEARPGHELQFASLVEKGVSLARGIFAFSSVNVEGWALYAEAEMKPYLPLEGQLISLQHRLLRAARAFLDPTLQAGAMEPEAAVKFLMDEVVMSEPMARQEVERYTFRAPGQATTYFYGYTRWQQLRAQAELALDGRFDRQRYHDFILAQGLLPPDILGQAVMNEFVPGEKAR